MSKMKIGISAGSVNTFCNNLKAAQARVETASADAVNDSAYRIFGAAQVFVPVQTGSLSSSGKVASFVDGGRIRSVISYGDETVNPLTGETTSEYAVVRHEIANPMKPGSYKWLERAVNNSSSVFLSELVTKLRNNI